MVLAAAAVAAVGVTTAACSSIIINFAHIVKQ